MGDPPARDRSPVVALVLGRTARIAGTVGAGIGGLYLAAWLAGTAARWSAAGVLTMKANMALALVLAGVALVLLDREGPSRARSVAATALGAVVLATGALTLAEHLLGWELGIDQLLASEAPGAVGTASPNRIGTPGALSLALVGAGLVLSARRRSLGVLPGAATCVLVVVPAVGFLYGVSPFYASRTAGIAWPTVVALLALGLGLVLAPRAEGPLAALGRDDPGGVLLRRALVPSMLVVLALGYLCVEGERHRLYDVTTGTALYAVSLLLLLSALLWVNAGQLRVHAEARERATEQLAAERRRLAVTLRSIGDGVIATDELGRVTILNSVAEALTGWTAAEARGRSLHEVFPIVNERTRAPVENPVDRVLREGVVVGLANHTALRARDGTERPIADSGAPIRDREGRVHGVVLVFRDQTEERRAAAALAAEHDRAEWLASFPARNPFPVLEVDLDGRVRYANAAAERLLPGIRDGAERHPWLAAWPEVAGAFRERGEAALERSVTVGPRTFHQSMYFVPETGCVRVYGVDVTARAAAEAAVREREERLRAHVAELVDAQAALREASRRKDEFLGMLSHELRNPLAPIRNSIFVLERAAPDGEQAARARGVIARQVGHLTRIVDDLLDVTRIERGLIVLHRVRVDLRELAAQAAEDFRHLLSDRGLELRVALPDAPLWVEADVTRLTQVIGNLLHNAAKFGGRGGEVTLSVRATGPDAELAVRDTGVGLDPALRPRVFDAFFQGNRTIARSEGGLGLGLAVVKAVAELHGGSARAESPGPGHGATFVVRVPLGPPPSPADARPSSPRPERTRRRVLVVDDNRDAAESLAQIVTMLGHDADVAFDGPGAVERARAGGYDTVLCDIGLPGMSGYEVAGALRAMHGASVRLVAVTGYAQPEDLERATAAGFDGHLVKPADVALLERWLA